MAIKTVIVYLYVWSSADVSGSCAHWESTRCWHWCQCSLDADRRARRHRISAAAETAVNWLVSAFPMWTGLHYSVWTEIYFYDEQFIVLPDWKWQWS